MSTTDPEPNDDVEADEIEHGDDTPEEEEEEDG
jgi:hypothetical protein